MVLPALEAQRMMELFVEQQRSVGFLTSLFRPVPGSTGSTGQSIQWDVVRYGQERAAVVSPGTGMRMNTVSQFTTKSIVPARYAEGTAVRADDLVYRMAGQDPYSAANISATMRGISQLNMGLVQSARKIDRSVEDQAAQILQTGTLNLPGAATYIEDFNPKATHFPTAAVTWADPINCTPLTDLENLCDVIHTDAKVICTRAIFGRAALANLYASVQFQTVDNFRRTALVDIDPGMMARGATLQGRITVGQYELEVWAYNEKSEPPGGGAATPYVDTNNVILLPDNPTLVVCSTIVPRVVPPDPRLAGFVQMPTTSEGGWDLVPNVWTDPAGDVLNAGFYASVVLVPQGIDEFGTLDTIP